ncbi:MAG: hypothetical protein IJ583_06340 [Firmicutes bacterium]|nr:hypothetical protein [Bacillota bacterium]
MNKANTEHENLKNELLSRFGRDGSLTMRKLREYIPPMIATNLSTLLLISVDGLVVGNFVGSHALASVNIFYPITLFIALISALVASGSATALSTAIGSSDLDKTARMKHASIVMMILAAIFVAFAQIPVVSALIASYEREVSAQTIEMMQQYGTGIMISMPFGLISTVGVYQLQISGKMKLLMKLAAMEGIVNLILDLLFVAVMDMGAAGAGYGTAAANIVRSVTTVIYIAKNTDLYKCGEAKAGFNEVKEILSYGTPDATAILMAAVKNYLIIQILVYVFGDDGGVINGVCVFCFGLVNVVVSGIQGGMRPLAGFMSGANDIVGIRTLLKQCIRITAVIVGIMTVLIIIFSDAFFYAHGIHDIPDFGILSLRLYSLYFVINGFDVLFRLYFVNRKKTNLSTALNISGTVMLILMFFILGALLPKPFLWLAYLFTSLIMLSIEQVYYLYYMKHEKNDDSEAELLYLSVTPDKAAEASELLQKYMTKSGCQPRMANKMSLCMEEMVSYAVTKSRLSELRRLICEILPPERLVELLPDELFDKLMYVLKNPEDEEQIPPFPGDVLKKLPKDLQEILQQDIEVYIIIRLTKDEGRFVMLDTGRCIALNEDKETKKLVTENYEFIKKLAKSVEYQYILDMNYSVISF